VAIDIQKIKGGQRLNDNELIEVVKFPLSTVEKMIKNGEIKDSKTIMCIYAWREKTESVEDI